MRNARQMLSSITGADMPTTLPPGWIFSTSNSTVAPPRIASVASIPTTSPATSLYFPATNRTGAGTFLAKESEPLVVNSF